MAWYKRKGKYYYVPANAQIINQEAEAEANIENENENEAETEQAQLEQNYATIDQYAKCLNVNAGAPGQNATITQTTGDDTATAATTQTADQLANNDAIAAAVPLNFGDQTVNE